MADAEVQDKEEIKRVDVDTVAAVQELVFLTGEPPKRRRGPAGSSVWLERLAPAMKHPNVWAQIPGEFSQSQTSQLRGGKITGINPKHWKFDGRTIPSDEDNKRSVLFVKYLGEGGESESETPETDKVEADK